MTEPPIAVSRLFGAPDPACDIPATIERPPITKAAIDPQNLSLMTFLAVPAALLHASRLASFPVAASIALLLSRTLLSGHSGVCLRGYRSVPIRCCRVRLVVVVRLHLAVIVNRLY